MSRRARITWKICWAAVMVGLLIVFSASEYDFIYRAF